MKYHTGTYICIAMMMVNIPGLMDKNMMSFISFVICTICAVGCFYWNERHRRSMRIW